MTTPTDHNSPSGQPSSPPPGSGTWVPYSQTSHVDPNTGEGRIETEEFWRPGPTEPPRKRSWFARHKILTILGAVFALIVIVGVASGGGGGGGAKVAVAPSVAPASMPPVPSGQVEANKSASNAPKAPAAPTAAPTTAKPKPPPAPALTAGQENAIGSAKDYLETQGFSRTGLIDQLKFEGYSTADATFAVNYIKPDWKEQAVRVAKDYLDTQHFSRSGLIGQLMFDGFTRTQATYAVDQVGL